MLVLSRKPKQKIQIGDNISVTVVRIRGNTIQLGIDAPREVSIRRSELLERSQSSDAESNIGLEPEDSLTESEVCASQEEDGDGHIIQLGVVA